MRDQVHENLKKYEKVNEEKLLLNCKQHSQVVQCCSVADSRSAVIVLGCSQVGTNVTVHSWVELRKDSAYSVSLDNDK